VANLLAGNVRLIDTVGRYGADEFLVLAPGATGSALAERIIAAAGAPQDAEPIGLRAGSAVYPDDGTTADELLVVAENRLRGQPR
jgi:GGDEF domain-containing protein